jgi:hypothetical protein
VWQSQKKSSLGQVHAVAQICLKLFLELRTADAHCHKSAQQSIESTLPPIADQLFTHAVVENSSIPHNK